MGTLMAIREYFTLHTMIPSGNSGFLSLSKDVQVGLTGYFKLPVGVLSLYVSICDELQAGQERTCKPDQPILFTG